MPKFKAGDITVWNDPKCGYFNLIVLITKVEKADYRWEVVGNYSSGYKKNYKSWGSISAIERTAKCVGNNLKIIEILYGK